MKTKKEKNIQSIENFKSELNEPRWSVVAFKGVVEKDLTYMDATAKMKKLVAEKIPGLCIVTNEASEKPAL
ncbi:MAG: hypothetical protein WKF90_09995 [Pyrinomonadaceae bacterium]|jgi:hypothetical protein|nr:hypothetical protein [Acidobacteriota bacterium]